MSAPSKIDDLIALMGRLPGLGPRSARRLILTLLKKRTNLMLPLAQMMAELAQTAQNCALCGNICTQDLCPICMDPRRATGEMCIVQELADLWAMERSGVFKGRYHILGGTLSALNAIGPEELRLPLLLKRLQDEQITEVILALNITVDGQTTAHYIADMLAHHDVKISSLAQGIPIGAELDYLDDGTIGAALTARRHY